MTMARLMLGLLVGTLVLTSSSFSLAADIEGMVLDARCKPVPVAHVLVEGVTGKILGGASTNLQGDYQIKGLSAGTYDYVLDASGTSFRGGSTTSSLNDKGLRIDWKVSPTDLAVAVTGEKTDKRLIACAPSAASPGTVGAAAIGGAALVAGGVIGGYGAAGGFPGANSNGSNSSGSQPPGSASQ